jgi:hypothetical protein
MQAAASPSTHNCLGQQLASRSLQPQLGPHHAFFFMTPVGSDKGNETSQLSRWLCIASSDLPKRRTFKEGHGTDN